MKIQTFSIIVGSEACNARCPFCVSKMTPPLGVTLKEPEVNWRNFKIACKLAIRAGVTTAMLTGKGEPTLFPAQITKFLDIEEFDFPIVELQTNGILIVQRLRDYLSHLQDWYHRGLTTVAISIVSYDPEKNRQIYLPHKKEYINLPGLIGTLHSVGFSVRLTCVLVKGYTDSPQEVQKLIQFAQTNKVEQLTLTPVNKPDATENTEVWHWTNENHLPEAQRQAIFEYLEHQGSRVLRLPHGAIVYDVHGQNVCMNNCLSVDPDSDQLRNLIFFPDGHLRYYWQYPGAIII